METKTLVSLLFFAFVAWGCNNQQDTREESKTQKEIVRDNAEAYLKPNMNDPESYEFVDLTLMDSVIYADNVEYRKNHFSRDLESNRRSLERQEEYKDGALSSMYNEEEVAKLEERIGRNNKILEAIDSLEVALGDELNDVASYTYIYSFRGNNAFGAKVLNEYILQTNPAPDFEIINMTTDEKRIILNPNNFPGYQEMIKSFYPDR